MIPVYAQRPDAPLPNGYAHAASAGNHELDPTAACERFPLVRGLACWTRAQQLSQRDHPEPVSSDTLPARSVILNFQNQF